MISRFQYPSGSGSSIKSLVSRNLQNELPPAEPQEFDTMINGFENKAESNGGCHEEVNEKIQRALKFLTLRDECSLIQFWAPCSDGKYMLLKTVDQPFHIGKPDDGLRSYRRESERIWFLVDEKCEEEELNPVARVFRRQLPEWTSDVMNYNSKKYPLQDCAIRLNLHGYLVLPVFDSHTMLCVGVLEFITYMKHHDCAYEVQEVHRTLKKVNLTSPQAFDSPISHVNYERIQHELDEIYRILKDLCDTCSLPLAQTWMVSSWSSYTIVRDKIEMTCCGFNSSCVGKVCMSTTALPFYVHDFQFWSFSEACREHHLLKSHGVVGKAMSSHGSSFCADVTELGEDEYPLVHNARTSGLRSCFAIYLNSREHDHGYVLEFFLPVHMKESAELQNLMQQLKLRDNFSSFECEDQVGTEVIGRVMELSQPSLLMQLNTSMSKEIMQIDSVNSQTVGNTNVQNDCISSEELYHFAQMSVNDVSSKKIDVPTEEERFTSCKKNDFSGEETFMEHRIEATCDDLIAEHEHKYSGKPIDQVSKSFGSLSSEMAVVDVIDPWTVNEEFNVETDFCNSLPMNDWNTAIPNMEEMFVDDATCKKNDFSGEETFMEHRIEATCDDLIAEHEHKYSGKPIDQVSKSFGSLSSEMAVVDVIDPWTVNEEFNVETDFCNSLPMNDWNTAIPNMEEMFVDDATCKKNDFSGEETFMEHRIEATCDDLIAEHEHKYSGKPIDQVSKSFGSLSSEMAVVDVIDPWTVNEEFNVETDFCNSLPMNDWNTAIPNMEEMFVDDATCKKNDFSGEETFMEHRIEATCDDLIAEHEHKYSGKPIDQVSKSFGSLSSEMAVVDVIAKKPGVVTIENGYNLERKGADTKRTRKRKMDSVTLQMIQQYFGEPIGEASMKLGVSRSTLKRVCRKQGIPRWPYSLQNKKYSQFSISLVTRLLIRVKRWSCSTNHHGFSGKWWICGNHNALASKSNQSDDFLKYLSLPLKELDDCIDSTTRFSKPQQACFGIDVASRLFLGLKRWRKRAMVNLATLCNGYLIDDGFSDVNINKVFPNKNVVNVSHTPKVTVKATYKDNTVKFDFPFSSRLSKLKNQVAQRIKLQATRILLKYKDEDDDLILIACDEDLCNFVKLSVTSAGKNSIKLIVRDA